MSEARYTEAVRQLLRQLPDSVPIETLDRVWVFAPRDLAGKESGLLVLTTLAEDPAADRRRLLTLRYQAERVRGTLRVSPLLEEQGAAPADRMPRLIEGVIGRLRDQREDPAPFAVGGDPARWTELLATAGAVDPPGGE